MVYRPARIMTIVAMLVTACLMTACLKDFGLSGNHPDTVGDTGNDKVTRGGWLTDVRTNCRIHIPEMMDRGTTATWSGNCIKADDGHLVAEGDGALEWRYRGALHGRYRGTVRKGYWDGEGNYEWIVDGNVWGSYQGGYSVGQRSGHGVEEIRQPAVAAKRYDGQYQNNLRHGSGRIVLASGIVFKGEFRNGKIDGLGIVVLPDSSWYTGTFPNDGKTDMTFQWPNGDVFVGPVQNDKPHGKGLFKPAEGTPRQVTFRDGREVG